MPQLLQLVGRDGEVQHILTIEAVVQQIQAVAATLGGF